MSILKEVRKTSLFVPEQKVPDGIPLFFGDIGTGKSRQIADLVTLGANVLVIHCGIGQHGLKAPAEHWAKMTGKPRDEFFNHCKVIEVKNISQLWELCNDKWQCLEAVSEAFPERLPEDFLRKLTHIGIEEANGIQAMIDRKLISREDMSPENSKDDKDAVFSYWRNMKAGTESAVKDIVAIQSPYRELKFFITCHDKTRDAEVQGEKVKSLNMPAFSGAAIKQVLALPDYVIRCSYETKGFADTARREYRYEYFLPDTEAVTKIRGEDWPNAGPANGKLLWQVIQGLEDPAMLGDEPPARESNVDSQQSKPKAKGRSKFA